MKRRVKRWCHKQCNSWMRGWETIRVSVLSIIQIPNDYIGFFKRLSKYLWENHWIYRKKIKDLFFRPDAVPLVDAFDFHDAALGTAIGTYDGHAYERLLLAAQDSELNKADVSFWNFLECCFIILFEHARTYIFRYSCSTSSNTSISCAFNFSGFACFPQIHQAISGET